MVAYKLVARYYCSAIKAQNGNSFLGSYAIFIVGTIYSNCNITNGSGITQFWHQCNCWHTQLGNKTSSYCAHKALLPKVTIP